jgi:glycosyltransferase involved in cell wall biosynthesis
MSSGALGASYCRQNQKNKELLFNMYEGAHVGVVVPAHNEEKLIGRVLETMPPFVDYIVVVDDASQDHTAEIVESYRGRIHAELELIRHPVNQGVGGAVISGYRRAIALGLDVMAVMAGDAQMAPAELASVIEPVIRGEADYVKGNRLFTGEAWEKMPRYRYFGNNILSLWTKIASGYWHIADAQGGYTAVSLRALKMLPLDKISRGYEFENSMLIHLNVFNLPVVNVPVSPVYGIGEKSGIRLWQVIPSMSWYLLKGFLWRLREKYMIRDFHPLLLFYMVGLSLCAIGLPLGLYLVVYRLLVGTASATSALLAALLFLSGMQLLLFALWLDTEYTRDGMRAMTASTKR